MIVAELSKSYVRGVPVGGAPVLAVLFESAIEFNWQRGYELHSWKLSRVFSEDGDKLNETIVAVFRRRADG